MGHPSSRSLAALALAATLAATGCASTKETTSSGSAGTTLTVGTTDKVTSLDPAGSYDNGSFFVMNQVYGFLLNTAPGTTDMTPKPDLAASASFTTPTEYTVKLKSGLKFVNGDELTSSDVKFSIDRVMRINDPNGPASLLTNVAQVSAPDPTTVVFKLKVANDQTFPQVLSGPAAPIVDEQVFPADKVLGDDQIVAKHPFSGQYDISSYTANQLVSYKAWPNYQGMLGAAKSAAVDMKYYASANNLKLDVSQGNIDVATRSLSATDIDSLKKSDTVSVHEGPGGEMRMIAFNLATMPFGTKAPGADPAKALAVRQAVADLVDRQALSSAVYKGTYTPLYGYVPAGLMGAGSQFKSTYGDGNGGPSLAKAKAVLQAAGVTTPVVLKLQYNPEHYGPSSGDEYAAIKTQLESGGLFTVSLQSTEWAQYSKDRTSDVYPVYQLGWFPDFSDPDNYLTPFFSKNNFVANHYDDAAVQKLLADEIGTPDRAAREALVQKIQAAVTAQVPTLPLLQGKQLVVAAKKVNGVTLDASFKFRLGTLSK